jgi:hypothetical protein
MLLFRVMLIDAIPVDPKIVGSCGDLSTPNPYSPSIAKSLVSESPRGGGLLVPNMAKLEKAYRL